MKSRMRLNTILRPRSLERCLQSAFFSSSPLVAELYQRKRSPSWWWAFNISVPCVFYSFFCSLFIPFDPRYFSLFLPLFSLSPNPGVIFLFSADFGTGKPMSRKPRLLLLLLSPLSRFGAVDFRWAPGIGEMNFLFLLMFMIVFFCFLLLWSTLAWI